MKVGTSFGSDADEQHGAAFKMGTSSFYTIVPPILVAELKLPAMMRGSASFRGCTRGGISIGVAYLRLMDGEGALPPGALEGPEPYRSSALLLDEEDSL